MRIIYEAGGGVVVIIPAPQCGLTVEQIAQKDVPLGVEYEIVPVGSIPTDRVFRNAWRKLGSSVAVDMPVAREIHMDRIRVVRNSELAQLDTDDEDNPKGYYEFEPVKKTKENASWVTDAVGKVVKMVYMLLYDLPETFDLFSAKTPEELKALWPLQLPR